MNSEDRQKLRDYDRSSLEFQGRCARLVQLDVYLNVDAFVEALISVSDVDVDLEDIANPPSYEVVADNQYFYTRSENVLKFYQVAPQQPFDGEDCEDLEHELIETVVINDQLCLDLNYEAGDSQYLIDQINRPMDLGETLLEIAQYYVDIEIEHVHDAVDVPASVRHERSVSSWWSVSDRLAHKLRKHNELVVEWNGHDLWGRETGGQSVYSDREIEDIVILDDYGL